MASGPALVVPSTSIDTAGISTATAAASASDPRAGSAYDLTNVAAAAPVWCHPLADGVSYLIICSRRWYAATAGASVGTYSAYLEDTNPSWFVVGNGQRTPVPGAPVDIPITTPVTSAFVVAGASRPPNYLWLLHNVTLDSGPAALIQFIIVNPNGTVAVNSEEILPTATGDAGQVIFAYGLQYSTPQLIAYGIDSAGAVYAIAKPWSTAGSTSTSTSPAAPISGVPTQVSWQYFNGTGYSSDPTELTALSGLITAGPMSFAPWRTQTFATTIVANGDARAAQVWTSSAGRPWVAQGPEMALGSVSAGTYLGSGMRLMPQLQASTAAVAELGDLPYVLSIKNVFADHSSELENAWGCWPLTGWVSKPVTVTAVFSGNGVFQQVSLPTHVSRSAPRSGSGVLTATARIYQLRVSAPRSGHGVLTATVHAGKFAVVGALTGTGALGTGPFGVIIPAPLSGGGALAPNARVFNLPARTSGSGTLAGTNIHSLQVSVPAFAGKGTLSAQAYMYQIYDSAFFSGRGVLTASAMAQGLATARFSGKGSVGLGFATGLGGTGKLTAAARIYRINITGALSGRGAFTAHAYAVKFTLAAPRSGHGAFTPTAHSSKFTFKAQLSGKGVLTMSGGRKVIPPLQGKGTLSTTVSVVTTPFPETFNFLLG